MTRGCGACHPSDGCNEGQCRLQADSPSERLQDVLAAMRFASTQCAEFADRIEAALQPSAGGEVVDDAPRPDWRWWYEKTVWWTAKAKEFGYDPENGIFKASDLASPAQPSGFVLVPRWLLEQVYGMAREGCEAPMAAYRWCERIDSIIHGAEPESEYADYARELPASLTAAPSAPIGQGVG